MAYSGDFYGGLVLVIERHDRHHSSILVQGTLVRPDHDARSAGWSPNLGEFGLQMDSARPLPRRGSAQAFSYLYVLVGFVLVDLVRFELTTSSMPFKTYQSVADGLAQNKRLSKRRGGLWWTPRGRLFGVWTPRGLQGLHTGAGMWRAFLRARLQAAVIVVCWSRQQVISLYG